ncbi:MAG TPA: ATP-binding protein [Pyrinomonadaceae bacterium]|nr:ATP-binding protein [Pyrinomonadaceae bacterium]
MRPKPFLTYFILCAIPLLLLAGLNYWNGIRSVDSTISAVAQDDLNSFNVAVDGIILDRKNAILGLTATPGLRQAVTSQNGSHALATLDKYFQSLTLLGRDRQPLSFRTEKIEWNAGDPNSQNNRPANLPEADPQVWTLPGNTLLDRPGRAPGTVEYTAPIQDETGTTNGALVGVLSLDSVFSNASHGLGSSANKHANIVVLDRSGKIVYHSDPRLKGQSVNEALPEFASIAKPMIANASGVDQFNAARGSYTVAYSPLPLLDVAVAVARNRSDFTSAAHLWGIAGLVLALLIALASAFVLERHVQRRSRGIAQVTEDLSAIAKGELDRRIILQSSDDARGIADNINVVTERLRAQIAREEESRQFESFVRLSAMLTHDLKNAIEALSLTVGNMERHYDNPQFRADALKGLTSATDKLKALVARLARPVSSLSGEHKRPTNVDLIPILERVIAMTAEPARSKHKIVLRLPANLFALVDAARIEEVMENLVLNALEAMGDKSGTLTIEAGQTAKGAPAFSISDTGHGMSRSFVDNRLFRPFSTTKKTGIGLGLYTCREVIKASGGSIDVDSVEGAGTTFRVVLPSTTQRQA